MAGAPRPPELVRAELIRLDTNLLGADERGDFEDFERWAREVLAHPCAPHTWQIGLVTDMLADCLAERDDFEGAIALLRASQADGDHADPYVSLHIAELLLASGDRAAAEEAYAELVGEGPVAPHVPLAIGLAMEDLADDAEVALAHFTAALEALVTDAESGRPVDDALLDQVLTARRHCRASLGQPDRDALEDRVLDAPLAVDGAGPELPPEFPPHVSVAHPCMRCGYRPGEEDAPVEGHRVAVAWDPSTGASPEVEGMLRRGRVDTGVLPALVEAPADVVAVWAVPYGYDPTGEEAAALYAAVAPDVVVRPWPPSRNEPCWCGSAVKYKRCCGR